MPFACYHVMPKFDASLTLRCFKCLSEIMSSPQDALYCRRSAYAPCPERSPRVDYPRLTIIIVSQMILTLPHAITADFVIIPASMGHQPAPMSPRAFLVNATYRPFTYSYGYWYRRALLRFKLYRARRWTGLADDKCS